MIRKEWTNKHQSWTLLFLDKMQPGYHFICHNLATVLSCWWKTSEAEFP